MVSPDPEGRHYRGIDLWLSSFLWCQNNQYPLSGTCCSSQKLVCIIKIPCVWYFDWRQVLFGALRSITVCVSRLWESPVCNECHLCFSYKIKDPQICHRPANHIMQILLIKKKPRQEQHKGKVTSFGSQLQGGEVKQAGARSAWAQTPTIRKQVECVHACSSWRSNVCYKCIRGHTWDKMERDVLR